MQVAGKGKGAPIMRQSHMHYGMPCSVLLILLHSTRPCSTLYACSGILSC